MKLPEIKGFSLNQQQQLIAKGSIVALLVFGLGFSCGRQSGVQERIAEADKPKASNKTETGSDAPPKEDDHPVTPASSIKEEVDPLTDETNYTFVIHSSNEIANSIGRGERDALIIRCKGNSTDAYISTTPFVSSDGQSVKLRWNGGDITSQWWGPASGGSALFSGAPVSLLNQMAEAEKLVISYQPYSKAAVSAVFEFEHARSDLKRMQEVCK